MRELLTTADKIIGHNIIRWDIPNLERVLKIKIKAQVIDTLALSWTMFPNRNRHGLEVWGEEFGIKKPEIIDWENQKLEDYIHRCSEDVKINLRLWDLVWNKLSRLYNSEKEQWKYIKYISFKIDCAALQEKNGWLLDVKYCEQSLIELISIRDQKLDVLRKAIPRVPVKVIKTKPKKLEKKDGSLSAKGREWHKLLEKEWVKPDTDSIEIIKDYKEGNPSSTTQVKEWLFSLGWKPVTFDYKKDSEGKTKAIPKVNLKEGKGLCESVKLLFDKEPALEELDSLSILNHRIPMLQKFLSTRDKDNKVLARVSGLTNTLRFQHAEPCVNLPRSDRKFAKAIRGSLISAKGNILCGADMSGLEDRLKHHFIFPHDPDYVHAMMRDDYDPHLTLAVMAGMISNEDVKFYLELEKEKSSGKELSDNESKTHARIKTIRSIAKNGNYACQYGAYPPRLALTCGVSLDKAKEVFDGYWKLNWAIKRVAEEQTVKELNEDNTEMWLRNPINGFYYSLRTRNDIFSTLVQGTASYCFDIWVQFILEERKQLTAQFHDEVVLEIKEWAKDKCTELINKALDKTNKFLNLNRELGVGIQYGFKYSDIH